MPAMVIPLVIATTLAVMVASSAGARAPRRRERGGTPPDELEQRRRELAQQADARRLREAEAQRLQAERDEAQRRRDAEAEAQRLEQLKRQREAEQLRQAEARRQREAEARRVQWEAQQQREQEQLRQAEARRQREAQRRKAEAQRQREAEQQRKVTPLAQWLDRYAGEYEARMLAKLGTPPFTSLQMCTAIVEVLPGELIDKLEADYPAVKPELALCAAAVDYRPTTPRSDPSEPKPLPPPEPEPDEPEPEPEPKPEPPAREPAPKPEPPPEPPEPKPPAPEPIPPKPAPEPEPVPELSPKEAAQRLFLFASMKIQAGDVDDLGTEDNPSETVRTYQAAMRRIDDDGRYGRLTRARGKELLGREFPVRRRVVPPAPEPPAPPAPDDPVQETRSAEQAARDLLAYVLTLGAQKLSARQRSRALGFKDYPNETVRTAQRDMGELDKDGIYSNLTRRRGKALIGTSFPPR